MNTELPRALHQLRSISNQAVDSLSCTTIHGRGISATGQEILCVYRSPFKGDSDLSFLSCLSVSRESPKISDTAVRTRVSLVIPGLSIWTSLLGSGRVRMKRCGSRNNQQVLSQTNFVFHAAYTRKPGPGTTGRSTMLDGNWSQNRTALPVNDPPLDSTNSSDPPMLLEVGGNDFG
jgi:hypothetical protein